LPNLYGDILSDIAAQLTGSVGLGGSANIGEHGAMFEAIHGAAPKRAGSNSANPSGLLFAAILMLNYLDFHEIAERIHNAWLKTLEMGIHTYDIYQEGVSRERVGTKEFADAVAKFLGQKPEKLKVASYHSNEKLKALAAKASNGEKRSCIGVDVYIHSKISPKELEKGLREVASPLRLKLITNRGARVWPQGHPETFCVDQFGARFCSGVKGHTVTPDLILATLQALTDSGFDIVKTENLYLFDEKPGFSNHEFY